MQVRLRRFTRTSLARALSCTTVPLLGVFSHSALAQPPAFEEIFVTGSRRQENVLDIPINITAVEGSTIQDLRLDGISKIAFYVPGLKVVDTGPRDEVPDILVRGLNTTGLGPGYVTDTVATYFGEIPLQLDIKPVDLERVEVLIGPQGTLYGQGTMGGAIRYLPVRADMSDVSMTMRSDLNTNIES
ncbi:MAG: TonB-dependent receptor plug domain-containing protein, partial [Pseudomonadota bacterium]